LVDTDIEILNNAQNRTGYMHAKLNRKIRMK